MAESTWICESQATSAGLSLKTTLCWGPDPYHPQLKEDKQLWGSLK